MKRNLNRRLICDFRCDEKLKDESKGSTRLGYTGWCGGLEHLKIETRLINEKFVLFFLFIIGKVRDKENTKRKKINDSWKDVSGYFSSSQWKGGGIDLVPGLGPVTA